MVCPKCRAEVPQEGLKCPGCNLFTPRGRDVEAAERRKKAQQKATGSFKAAGALRTPKQSSGMKSLNWKDTHSWKTLGSMIPGWVVYILLGAIFVGAGLMAYGYIYSTPPKEQAQESNMAITQAKGRLSKKDGTTLDQALKAELAKLKASGNLVSYQGWTVKPKNRGVYLVSFVYEEKDGTREASWLVDVPNNQFVPQTELAASLTR